MYLTLRLLQGHGSWLRSVDVDKGVAFHTYSLPEDRCTRLLIKDLGKNMPDQDVRKEVESLTMPVQSVLQLRSQRHDPDHAKDRFPTPHLMKRSVIMVN